MSFGDELVKLSLSHGYSRLVGAVDTIARAVEAPARAGLWETTVEFQGEWYEDEGNQKSIGVHLSDQELFLVDVTATQRGSLLFHVSWGEDVEWRKGRRDREAKTQAKKEARKHSRAHKARDPNDPEYQEFLMWKARLEQYKAESRNGPEYREFQESRRRYNAKKEAEMASGEYAQYKLEKREALARRRHDAMAAELEEHAQARSRNREKKGLAPRQELPPFPALVPPEMIQNIALPVKVERSVVAEAGHFITDLAPKPGRIVEVAHKKKDLSEAEARAKAEADIAAKRAAEAAAAEAAAAARLAEQQERAESLAAREAVADDIFHQQQAVNSAFLSNLRPGDHVGHVKAPKAGPIRVELAEGERLMCRCGQSDFYPYCDQGCKKLNAERGTTFAPWKANVETAGSDVIYACGCGQSALFRSGAEGMCDNTCSALPADSPSGNSLAAARDAKLRQEESERAAAETRRIQEEETRRAQEEEQKRAAAEVARREEERAAAVRAEHAEREKAEQHAAAVAAANALAAEQARELRVREENERREREQQEAEKERQAEAEALRVQEQNRALAAQHNRTKTWRDLATVPLPVRLLTLGKQREGAPAMQFSQKDGWGAISWAQYAGQVETTAKALLSIGLTKGGRVVLLSDTRPEWAVIALAVQLAGGVLVIAPPTVSSEMLQEIAAQTQPTVVVVDDVVHWDRLARVVDAPAFSAVKAFVGIQSPAKHAKGLSWAALLARAGETSDATLEGRYSQLKMSDVSTICYSDNRLQANFSEMRGARLTFDNEAFAADTYTELLGFGGEDRMLVFMPFSDTTNRALSVHQTINSGSVTYFGEEIDKLHANLTSVQPTVIFSAPVLWERFEAVIKARLGSADPAALPTAVKEKLRKFIGCQNLRVALSGTAAVHVDTVRFYNALGITLRNVYSKTALSGVCSLDMGAVPTVGAAGKAVHKVQLRVSSEGLLEVSGPNVFAGYHNKPALNGWFATGDIASVAENGDVTIAGSAANSFKLKSGAVVHPEGIELELRSSPVVSGAYVFGKNRDFAAAIIAIEREALAATAKKLGVTTDEVAQSPETLQEVEAHVQRVNARLPEALRIKKYRVIPREFSSRDNECTPTMLLNRAVVQSKFASLTQEIFQ